MIELDEVAGYLLHRGLIEPAAIVDGGLTVTDLSRRNRVFLVTARGGRGLVLKASREPGARSTVDREARVLPRVAGSGDAWLSDRVPAIVAHDRDAGVLVLSTFAGARDLARHHREHARGRFSCALAREAGAMLGRLHGLAPATFEDLPPAGRRGWGMGLHRPDLARLHTMSAASQELVVLVQRSRPLCDRLDELRASPAQPRPIHGDVRWANWLATARPSSRRCDHVALIDWELACCGDPCLDLGAFIGEYLREWVQSIPIVDVREPARLLDHARSPLRRMQPALRAFWAGYRDTLRLSAPAQDATLLRAIRFAAVRVLEALSEESDTSATLRGTALFEVQLSLNLLERPADAASGLLGIVASPRAAA